MISLLNCISLATKARRSVVLLGLIWAENCSLKLADVTIATNESYKQSREVLPRDPASHP